MRRASCLSLLLLLSVPTAVAQGEPEAFNLSKCIESFEKIKLARQLAEQQRDPITDEKIRMPLGASDTTPTLDTEASLVAGDENGRAFISLSSGEDRLGSTDLALKVTVPFDKSREEGVFLSRTAVSGDVTLSASIARYGWDLEPAAYGRALCERCAETGIEKLKECYPENPALFAGDEGEAGSLALQDVLFGKVETTMWGVEGSIGRKERSYFDMNAEKRDEDRAELAFSVFGGARLPDSSIFVRLTGKRRYMEGKTVQKCVAVEDVVDLESCETRPLGRALEQEGLVGSLDWVKPLGSVVMAPGADYDFEESEWTVRLPIYLLRNDDDGWVGGLKIAWTSDGEEELGVAIFVTKPLEF